MAKVSKKKETKRQVSSSKLKSVAKPKVKAVAKNIKTLKSIKKVVLPKNGSKNNTKKIVIAKKKVSGKKNLSNGKAVVKSVPKKEKSHVNPPKNTRDTSPSTSNSKPGNKVVDKPSKKSGPLKEPEPSKVVTRRDSKEKETNKVKISEKKMTKSQNVQAKTNVHDVEIKSKAIKRVTFNVEASSPKKVLPAKEPKKKPVVNKQRVASLNATCKVKMMYETNDDNEDVSVKEVKKVVKKEEPIKNKSAIKEEKKIVKSKGKVVKKSKKKVKSKMVAKRKNQDDVDTSLILDSRSSKRVASLNASAILAATLLPEPPMPKPPPKPKVDKTVEKVVPAITTDSNRQPTPPKKRKQQKSGEDDNPVTKKVAKAVNSLSSLPQSSKKKKNKSYPLQSAIQMIEGMTQPSTTALKSLSSPIISRPPPKVTGVTTTKLEVTKVQINSSGTRKEKTDHQVKTILGKDFVGKYQIETNSSQSYCVQVHNSSVETHHQPMIDQSLSVSRTTSSILNVPPPAHLDSTIMSTTQSLSSSFPPFSHLHQPQAHNRPIMQVGSVQGLPSFTPLSILNIPHFALSSPHHRSSSNLRPNVFGLPPPLDLSHGNYSPAAAASSSGFTLLNHPSPMYQPAGPMIQSNPDSSCLVHKPIPFHPPPSSHLAPHSANPHSSSSFQPQITQSLSSVSGSIFQTSTNPSGLFHQHRLQQSHLQTQPCAPIFVSTVPTPNLGLSFNPNLSFRPSLPFIQGSSADGFAPRNAPWFQDLSPRTASVSNYHKGSGSKTTYQTPHFPRSPHVATVRPQVSKKQKEPARNKKTTSTTTSKEVVVQRQQQPPPAPLPLPSPPRRDMIPIQQNVTQTTQSSPVPKPKKKFAHGWSWFGKRFVRRVFVHGEGTSVKEKTCFPAIKHVEGEVIRVGDSVLLRSGPRKTDLPFVARITALWESSDGEMMMSLLWYYRPEHTEIGRTPRQMTEELFASKHRDVNSVACVDDKCYVLTMNEFNRFKRFQQMVKFCISKSLSDGIVPRRPDQVVRKSRIPPLRTSSEMVFCCRKVYEFRLKRTLKNPA